VVLFVVIPLAGGSITRSTLIKRRGFHYFQERFVPKFKNITIIGLLLTLIMIFSFQGSVIIENPLHILLISVPLVIQTFLMFAVAYTACKLLRLSFDIAAPAGLIGASNFFELAVAVAITYVWYAKPCSFGNYRWRVSGSSHHAYACANCE
jgi:ACR3 family arsenite transporter